MQYQGYEVDTSQLDKLLKDAYLVGVDVKDLRRATAPHAEKMANLAKANAKASFTTPARRRKGKLLTAIYPKKSRVSVTIATRPRVPYVARQHWGLDGVSGPRWAEKARDSLVPSTVKALETEINRLMANRNL